MIDYVESVKSEGYTLLGILFEEEDVESVYLDGNAESIETEYLLELSKFLEDHHVNVRYEFVFDDSINEYKVLAHLKLIRE